MIILNLTQHDATSDQVAAGVVEPEDKGEVRKFITFDELPDATQIRDRAIAIAELAARSGYQHAMIGGAPFFCAPLEAALRQKNVEPLYAFTMRKSVEESDGKGGIRKVAVFLHAGFVPALQT